MLRLVVSLTRFAKGNAMSDLVSMSRADLAALIAAEVSKAVSAVQSSQPKSDFKIVVTRGIPAKSGRLWGTVEITDQRTGEVTRLFTDRALAEVNRKDGATQEVIYASVPAERKPAEPAPAVTPAPVAKAKATRKA